MSFFTKAFLTVICLPILNCCNAQHISLVKKELISYDENNYPVDNGYTYRFFLVDGEKSPRRVGFFGQHLREYVQSDPIALQDMLSFSRLQSWKLGTTGSVILFGGLFAGANAKTKPADPVTGKVPVYGQGYEIGLVVSFVTAVILWVIPPKKIAQAVDSYNNSLNKAAFRFSGIDLRIANGPIGAYPSIGIKLGI